MAERKMIYLDDAVKTIESFYRVASDILRKMTFELKDLPSAQPEKRTEERAKTHACDLIDRQAVRFIESESKYEGDWNQDYEDGFSDALEKVLALPSAQPEIIRCKDCKWFGDIGCAINIVDASDRPTEMDFCSFAERSGHKR